MRDLLESIRARKQRVLVVGLGVSGLETTRFLQRIGILARCAEAKSSHDFEQGTKFISAYNEIRAKGAEICFDLPVAYLERALNEVGLVVFSPGVAIPPDVAESLAHRGIPWCGELELGLRLASGRIIAVTGSNGKSTTASLVAHILRHSGIPHRLCGNIGVPLVSSLAANGRLEDGLPHETLVVEASSYQLAGLSTVRIHTHIVLNLSENHLERHGSMEGYRSAKAAPLAAQMADDVAILNADDPWVSELGAQVRGRLGLFGEQASVLSKAEFSACIHFLPLEGRDSISLSVNGVTHELDTKHLPLLGRHNRLNAGAAMLGAATGGADIRCMKQALRTFAPLEHRIEPVTTELPGTYINDSKATTVAAVVAAISAVSESYPSSPLWLLLGGRAKVGSWLPVIQAVQSIGERLRGILCFGEDGAAIQGRFAASGVTTISAERLEDAVRIIRERARRDEVILFSPGCASFDAFRDFEERGTVFKSLLGTR